MPLHAVWVHGTSVRSQWFGDNLLQVRANRWTEEHGDVPWSDIVGLPEGFGTTFRGKRSHAGGFLGASTHLSLKPYWFHYSIPTPVVAAGRPADLLRVFVLWQATQGVRLRLVHVFDGPRRFAELEVTHDATGRTGDALHEDLIEGTTMFNLPAPHRMVWSVGITLGVFFEEEGNLTLGSAGADFEIP